MYPLYTIIPQILVPQAADADDEDASEGGSDAEDDSDDEAALMAELARIKKARSLAYFTV